MNRPLLFFVLARNLESAQFKVEARNIGREARRALHSNTHLEDVIWRW